MFSAIPAEFCGIFAAQFTQGFIKRMMLMRATVASLFLSLTLLIFFTGCGKEQAPGTSTSTTPVYDTASGGKPVAENPSHFIYLRPPVGDVYRYRVIIKAQAAADHVDSLFGTYPPHEELAVTTTLYLRQSIRQIRQDSTVDIAFRFDTIKTVTQSGDKKTDFSTARPSDIENPQFANAAAIAGKDLGAIVTRNGDVIELYGTSAILAKMMSKLPDSVKTAEVQARLNQNIQSTITEYIQKTLTHFPAKQLAKDTSWGGKETKNIAVWQQVLFPAVYDSREVVRGFEERGGKVLAIFDASTTVKPTMTSMVQGTAKMMLNQFDLSTKASSHVEDATGVLVYRTITVSRATNFTVESKSKAGKRYQVSSKANETTTVELLQ